MAKKKEKYTDKEKIQVLRDTVIFLLNALQKSDLIDVKQLEVLKSKLMDTHVMKYALKNQETYLSQPFQREKVKTKKPIF